MKNKNYILIYLLIGLVFCVLIALYFIINKNNDTVQHGFYKNCNQITDANAPILPSSILNDKNDLHLLHALKNGITKPITSNYEFKVSFNSVSNRYLIT